MVMATDCGGGVKGLGPGSNPDKATLTPCCQKVTPKSIKYTPVPLKPESCKMLRQKECLMVLNLGSSRQFKRVATRQKNILF